MLSGERLRFYIGADPTAKALHLGHAQNLMTLEDFRRLGHEVIFLIGDFTALIGDPDKSSARAMQIRSEIEENFKDWLSQTRNILSFEDEENPVQVKYNADWLSELKFNDVVDLASNFTVQQMLERDMFEKRMNEGKPIHLHEFFYPLMQGYDSVAMDVDVELCGTDQVFNALAGRTLLRKLKGKDKFVVANNLIQDEKTGQLMSKSAGTGVFLDLNPTDLYGAIMAQSDGMIKPLLLGCTRLSLEKIKELMRLDNPRDAKMELAMEIVRIYHGKEDAIKAQEYFVKTIQKKEAPDEVASIEASIDTSIVELVVQAGLAESNADAKRKIKQGGVSVDGEKVNLDVKTSEDMNGKTLKVGKKDFREIKITQ